MQTMTLPIIDSLTPQQAAYALGYSIHGIAQWRRRGVGPPYFKVGHRIYYKKTDIVEWLQRRRVETQD